MYLDIHAVITRQLGDGTEPCSPAEGVVRLCHRGLRLPELSPDRIRLQVFVPSAKEDPQVEAARRAILDANLQAVLREMADHGVTSFTLTDEMHARLTAGVDLPASPQPSPEQVEVVARLIAQAGAVARAIEATFATQRARHGDPCSFEVDLVRVRQGTSMVMEGSCDWDEEHGFAVEVVGAEVVRSGGRGELS